ncbi:hypothetical protein FNJ47_04570 [Bradyrhizobium sp. UFLA 03-164]|uniref:Uncharacterized protein n=1 Tax=Bradyrhizobium uaiense TaxID=2594946 RepID=A0A6P1BCB2_9BRAD|nr:hypothetical protein [Bradyrhizobium uaiense]
MLVLSCSICCPIDARSRAIDCSNCGWSGAAAAGVVAVAGAIGAAAAAGAAAGVGCAAATFCGAAAGAASAG